MLPFGCGFFFEAGTLVAVVLDAGRGVLAGAAETIMG
jgi:hypothetical protein